nr:type ISP restriction/modification enzyme [Pseudonocardia sp. SID8383]
MAIAALRGGADVNADKLIELDEARQAIEGTSPVLAAALGPVLGVRGLLDQIRHEVGAIERLASAVDPAAIARSEDPRGEPWLWFYEDFLHAFDPEARKKAGVYYTPTDVVQHQVRVVEDILRIRFNRKLGFADSSVVTLDPACGSGTYPLAIIDAAAQTATRQRGPAGPAQVAGTLARNLISFELMPGPYAVAHLRIGQRIAEVAGQLLPPEVRVYLTDTLDDPSSVPETLPLWGDADVLAEERRRAQMVKRDEEVMVAIGNPPYDRVSQSSGVGGWVVSPGAGRALFADILEPAQASTKFSHIASLYNLYIYFWRWAIWKTFEAAGDGPAVVSFITASSWLSGPGFVGLRKLAQELGDEIWVCDLGGNNRGPRAEENVFAIETPVAVVTIMRDGASDRSRLPKVLYCKLEGSRRDKLRRVSELSSPIADPADWVELTLSKHGDLMTPRRGDDAWHEMPSLAQIFPWQFPGLKAGRTWPIAPSPETLKRRWRSLVELPTAEERAEAYVTAATGRNIHTKVQRLPQLSALQADADHEQIVRYAYRSFDREWIIKDPRLLALERPALWASLSDQQIFLSTMMTTPLGSGPSMTAAVDVPDLHHFRGNYGGKDTIPLYRDAGAIQPNITKGFLEAIGSHLRESDPVRPNPQPEDIAAYVYALLSAPAYHERFSDALTSPGPRVPLTSDPTLFHQVVEIGKELLWLHTFGERCNSRQRSSHIPREPQLGWLTAVSQLPDSMDEVVFDASSQTLRIGDGQLSGVEEAVWNLEVSGYAVLRRWIAHRTRRGYGRAASSPKPLDKIRPEVWEDDWNDDLLDVVSILNRSLKIWPAVEQILVHICEGPLISASELPTPSAREAKEPTS